jgi:hypothetical protein
MRRRALLSTFGASLLAGCGAFGDEEGRRAGTFGVDDPPTATETTASLRPVSYAQFEGTTATLPAADRVVAFSPAEAGSAASLVLRVRFERDADATRPATLRATLRNRSDEAVTIDTRGIPAFEPEPVYGPVNESTTGGGFALAPTPDHPFSLSTPAVAQSGDGSWTVPSVDEWLPPALSIDPWSDRTGRYALVDVDPGRETERDGAGSATSATDADADANRGGGADAGDDRSAGDAGDARDAGAGSVSGGGAGIATGRYRVGDGPLASTAYVWRASAPGPVTDDALDSVRLPPLRNVETWYRDVTPATRTYLAPDRTRVSAPGTVGFELVNHSEDPLVDRTDEWQLYRVADGAWWRLTWRRRGDVSEPILPGERVPWTVRVAHGDGVPAGDGTPVPYLGGGVYAFAIAYGDGFAAAFELDAPDLSLAPASGVRTERDGDVLVVTDPVLADDATGDADAVTFELESVAGSPTTTFVVEQVYRDPVLRNALAFADEPDGAAVVRYRTTSRPRGGPFQWGRGPFRFAYEGGTYEVALVADERQRRGRPSR